MLICETSKVSKRKYFLKADFRFILKTDLYDWNPGHNDQTMLNGKLGRTCKGMKYEMVDTSVIELHLWVWNWATFL